MRKKILVWAIMLSIGSLGACKKSETEDKPEAVVTEPAETAEAAPEGEPEVEEGAAAAGEDKEEMALMEIPVNTEASKIEWVGAKVTGDHTGGFKDYTGKMHVGPEGEVQKVEFEVDTTSIYSDTDKLTEHLMSADFFDVEKYPKATFVTTGIKEIETAGEEAAKAEGDEETADKLQPEAFAATHEITGNLMLRGVTKQITFPAVIKEEEGQLKANSQFTINRFDWGIEYKGKPDDLIKEKVLLKLDLQAPAPEKKG